MGGHGGVPPGPILAFLLAKVFRDQRILGREAAVKAHLVGAGFLGNQVNADAANAVPIKELAGGVEDAIAHPRLAGRCRGTGTWLRIAMAWGGFVAAHA